MNVALSLVDSFFCCSDVLQKCSHTAKRSDNTNFNLFVAAISRRKSNQFEFVRLVAATKFCCSDNDFDLNSPVHTKRFVAATCRCDLLQRHVASCVPTFIDGRTSINMQTSKIIFFKNKENNIDCST